MSSTDTTLDEDLEWVRTPIPRWEDLKGWLDAAPLCWGAFLLRPGRRIWPRDDLSSVPMSSGIYALCLGGGIVYVGRSGTLHDRLKTHYYNSRASRSAWHDGFMFVRVPAHALEAVEIAHIHALEPERNNLFEPPEWEGHDAAVAALRRAWSIT